MLSLVPSGGEAAFFDIDAELAALAPTISAGGNS
jgi:hypothetical protein